jgi:NB-ARC domain
MTEVRTVDAVALRKSVVWALRKPLNKALNVEADKIDHAALATVAETLEPRTWPSNPTAALLAVFRRAVERLPDEAPSAVRKSWRELGRILCGFSHVEEIRGATGQFHHRAYRVAFGYADHISEETFGDRVVSVLYDRITEILYGMYYSRVSAQATRTADMVDKQVIRFEPADRVRALLDDGQVIVCIHGDAGTGKTVLARQIARALTDKPFLLLRIGNPHLLQDDTIKALIAEGAEPASWSESYARVTLRDMLAKTPTAGAVVIDGIVNEDSLWQFVPEHPAIPVIVTSRTRIRNDRVANVLLSEFTEDEAYGFLERHLGERRREDLSALISTLGRRTLTLSQVVAFLRESPDIDLKDLTGTLARSVASGLKLLSLPMEQAASLVQLYRATLAAVMDDDPARELLDSFLVSVGRSAAQPRELVHLFMTTAVDGFAERLRFRSGLRALAEYGLLYEDGAWLIMHPLTRLIQESLANSHSAC